MSSDELYIDNLTVTIPTYNRIAYLKIILDSIPSSIKIIVGDNGAFLPEDFKEAYPNVKFEVRNEVLSAVANWNKCIQAVQTEWFIIPSDDDLFYQDSFTIIKQYLEKFSDADMLIFGHQLIDNNGGILGQWVPPLLKEYKAPFGFDAIKYGVDGRFPSIVMRTEKVKEAGYLDETYNHTATDTKMLQQLALIGTTVFVPEIAGAYRTWPQSSTIVKSATKDWMDEITKWQDEILKEVGVAYSKVNRQINTAHIKDEVLAQNLLNGLSNLKGKSFEMKKDFLKTIPYPWNAKIKTHLKIIKSLL